MEHKNGRTTVTVQSPSIMFRGFIEKKVGPSPAEQQPSGHKLRVDSISS